MQHYARHLEPRAAQSRNEMMYTVADHKHKEDTSKAGDSAKGEKECVDRTEERRWQAQADAA